MLLIEKNFYRNNNLKIDNVQSESLLAVQQKLIKRLAVTNASNQN